MPRAGCDINRIDSEVLIMKLTDNLEKQAESAAVKEEKGETIGKAVLQLNDHELEAVSGGRTYFRNCVTCDYKYGSPECEGCMTYRG